MALKPVVMILGSALTASFCSHQSQIKNAELITLLLTLGVGRQCITVNAGKNCW